jgi:C4-dicarboxylate transporter, DctQ subunit
MQAVLKFHDRITHMLFVVGVILIGLIGVLYVYEVGARYFFNAPTSWGNDTSSFMLSIATFLCIPQLVRDGGHVAVTIVFQYSSPNTSLWIARITAIAAAIICAAAAYMTFEEVSRQIANDILTNTTTAVPKWWITVFMPYGLANAALYFVRTLNRIPAAGI